MNTGINPNQPELVLRDIHLPAPPEFWPPAPGWWVLVLLSLVALFYITKVIRHSLRVRRQQKHINQLLAALQINTQQALSIEQLSDLSALLKRVALTTHSQHEVASLSGDAWLLFLDVTGGKGDFKNGVGSILGNAVYLKEQPKDLDVEALIRLIKRWLKKNTRGDYGN